MFGSESLGVNADVYVRVQLLLSLTVQTSTSLFQPIAPVFRPAESAEVRSHTSLRFAARSSPSGASSQELAAWPAG